ncbi:MAG: NAD-dependent epimerase/dehydratase family protein [Planctomycetota bacterium]
MKALITGANGLIGANLVRELLSAGDDVKCMVRATSDTTTLADVLDDIEVAFGDVRDPDAIERALETCDRVYHTAALAEPLGNYDEHIATNVIGTRNVCAACASAGIERLVITSSALAVGGSTSEIPIDEDAPYNLGGFDSPLINSRHLAHIEALQAAARGLDVVQLCPTGVLGPYDRRPSPAGALVLQVLRGQMRVMDAREVSLVDARDVAIAHRLAMEKGSRGERYLLANTTISIVELAETVAQVAGVRAPGFSAPDGLFSAWLKLRYILPGYFFTSMQRRAVHTVVGQQYSAERSRSGLGMVYRPLSESWQAVVNWFFDSGMARRPSMTGSAPAERPEMPSDRKSDVIISAMPQTTTRRRPVE